MPYSFLEATNETLKRTGDIAGDAGDLTSFTDSARQTTVDVALKSRTKSSMKCTASVSFRER
ncbi:hypothetical protein LCGC14_2949200 [marine sediment metagenome]|uniref:Uncharacterized protein n=1 Tax=marine sediment metagenome TaxID=412755 RepID=A0A0F8XFL0_9ZZZZ